MDIDMSRSGAELFPESSQDYNSYDVAPVVEDYLDTGVNQQVEAAPAQSDKELNFRALREETAKLKSEREYWRGQAEAFSRQSPETPQEETLSSLDWDDGRDVQKAFMQLKSDNDRLRGEMRDQLAAASAKAQYNDWDNLVSQHVPQLTSKNPIFAEMIRNTSNPYEAAYLLSQMNAQSQQPAASENATRAIANASKPRSPSSVGGQGKLSSADYYASMSDEDFMKIAAKNMASI